MSDAFRQPSLTAKMTSTLDALSDGRFIFFFDAGWGLDEQRAYGYPDRPASERLERLDESLDLITQLWSGATVNYAGKHFHTNDAVCLPTPVRRPPIWLGEVRDDAYLDIIGRYADGWNSVPVSPQQFGERWAKVAAACTRAGRDPDALTRSLEIQILIAPTRSAVREILEECAALPISPRIPANATIVNYLNASPADAPPLPEDVASHWLIGTPDEVHSQLEAYAHEGVSHLMLWFADFPSHDGMRLFADEVMPRWRA
jgi:alkanesulfonate monooxygenase SsuD/methylene tetrahydromethanopterin reductase-like flavin-dependent oxidoreductase (luciferase family)